MADQVPTPPSTPAKTLPTVTTATGQVIQLLHQREKDYYEEARDKYTADYQFTHANDFRTLDRLLNLEVVSFRYQWFTLAGIDYDGTLLLPKEETEYRRAIKDMQGQISDIQKDLGVSKAERERRTTHDDVGTYITELLQRAKQFGLMRNQQMDRSLELTHELLAMVGAFLRSNENERRKLGIESPDVILAWIWDHMRPEFEAIDQKFKNDGPDAQKYWIRSV